MANHGEFPAKLLPDCWSDDERMGVLFAPFRERSVNPENFDGKMRFWREMITQYCNWRGSAQVTVMDVEEGLKRNGKKSYCIEKVFNDMQTKGALKLKENFLEAPQHTWMGWTKNLLINSPVKKTLQAARNTFFPQNYREIAFVVQEVVENHASKLHKLLEGKLLSQHDVAKEAMEKLNLSSEGVSLAIHALHCQQRVAIHRVEVEEAASEELVLKFAAKGEKILEISPLEYSIYDLEAREKELTGIVNKLEEDVKREDQKARENVRMGNRNLAKLCLQKRRALVKQLEKHTGTLLNIQELLTKIHEVSHNRKVVQAYKHGGQALKDALEKSGITLEMVEQTVDEVRDAIGITDDIEAALGGDLAESPDNAELEKELELLLEEDRAENCAGNAPYDELFKRLEALQIPDDLPSPRTPTQTETSQY